MTWILFCFPANTSFCLDGSIGAFTPSRGGLLLHLPLGLVRVLALLPHSQRRALPLAEPLLVVLHARLHHQAARDEVVRHRVRLAALVALVR